MSLIVVATFVALACAVDWDSGILKFNGSGVTRFVHSRSFGTKNKCVKIEGISYYSYVDGSTVYFCPDNCTTLTTTCTAFGVQGEVGHAVTFGSVNVMGGPYYESAIVTGTTVKLDRDASLVSYSIDGRNCNYDIDDLGEISYHAMASGSCIEYETGRHWVKTYCTSDDLYRKKCYDRSCTTCDAGTNLATGREVCAGDDIRQVRCKPLPTTWSQTLTGLETEQGTFEYRPLRELYYSSGMKGREFKLNATTGDYDVSECDEDFNTCDPQYTFAVGSTTSKFSSFDYSESQVKDFKLARMITTGPVNLRENDAAKITVLNGFVQSIEYYFDFPIGKCIQDPNSLVNYTHRKFTCHSANKTVVTTFYQDSECAVAANSVDGTAMMPNYMCGPFTISSSAKTIDVLLKYSGGEITIVAIVVAAISGVVIALGIIALIGILVVYFVGQVKDRRVQKKVHPVAGGPDQPVQSELQDQRHD